jgi:hypothetical protein
MVHFQRNDEVMYLVPLNDLYPHLGAWQVLVQE